MLEKLDDPLKGEGLARVLGEKLIDEQNGLRGRGIFIRPGRFENVPGGSGGADGARGAGAVPCTDLTEKKAISCALPLSSSVKSSLVKLVAGPFLSRATTSTSISLVPILKVGAEADSSTFVCCAGN
jgi:hypothetical protein